MTEIDGILKALRDAPDQAAALATLVSVEGSSYRHPGARLLALKDGRSLGSISGGCLEADVLIRMRTVLETGQPAIATYNTTEENDLVWGTGMGCQGVVQVFIEQISTRRPPWTTALADNLRARTSTEISVVFGDSHHELRGTHLASELGQHPPGAQVFHEVIMPVPSLALFGAGDDAMPLVRIAKQMGWHVRIFDSRPSYATRQRFPEADEVTVASTESLDECVHLDAACLAVVMTHRFAEDVNILRWLAARPPAYIGMLGPRKRTDRLIAELRAGGVAIEPRMMERLYSPVGLDLGASTPESIALSIVAEIQCLLSGRKPIHLRDRTAPIHG